MGVSIILQSNCHIHCGSHHHHHFGGVHETRKRLLQKNRTKISNQPKRPRNRISQHAFGQDQWREQFGINVVYIKRGEKVIPVPDRNQFILPFDQVGIVATDSQVTAFKPVFDCAEKDADAREIDIKEIAFDQLVVNEYARLRGLSIRDSGLRERTNGLIIGIERNNERLLNPDSSTVLDWDDVIWIVGERSKIQSLKESKPSSK